MTLLAWTDLVLEVEPHPDHARWLEPWSSLLEGSFTVRFLNRFGCWFLERPGGTIEILDVFYGQIEPLAASRSMFEAMVSDPSWQEVYLLTESVFLLHAAGKVARGATCYALSPPPLLDGPDPWSGEPLPIESVDVRDAFVLQSLYAQVHRVSRQIDPA